MMKKIYKYQLKEVDFQILQIPGFNMVLKVAEQSGLLFAWILIEPEKPNMNIYVRTYGTGHEITDSKAIDSSIHSETVLMSSGLVWHVFLNLTQ